MTRSATCAGVKQLLLETTSLDEFLQHKQAGAATGQHLTDAALHAHTLAAQFLADGRPTEARELARIAELMSPARGLCFTGYFEHLEATKPSHLS